MKKNMEGNGEMEEEEINSSSSVTCNAADPHTVQVGLLCRRTGTAGTICSPHHQEAS